MRLRPLIRHASLPCLLLTLLGLWYIYDQHAPNYTHLRHPPPPSPPPPNTSYVLFNQLRGAGFNNQLQESLLLSHIAALSGRAYVYRDVVWRPRGYDTVPAEVFFDSLTAPPGISEEAFWEGCEKWGGGVMEVELGPVRAEERVGRTVQMLRDSRARCVYVKERIMDWSFLETDSALQLYPSITPHLRSFTWSSPVLHAVARISSELRLADSPYMAIHLRRGDFMFHCPLLVSQRATYNLWARLPVFSPPPSSAPDILAHCWPSLAQILQTVRLSAEKYAARTGREIRTVYALHDLKYDAPWVLVLLRQLDFFLARDGRRLVYQKRLRVGEGDLGVPVDVELARRAAVFVGNGYSSLSSNVAVLRLVDGVEDTFTGFW